ncbi:uncharacterized protein LOC115442910 isoform X2 [Manduca sexta]|uniref:uncharacterized protein LOC115442910 isoform X2 n=1 Tax=Manduca sexta TaxID=7130 RepID=UPI00188EC0CB|nr:uncharacterized protein LOC115442910 isoform X2 [Manduca sexta]
METCVRGFSFMPDTKIGILDLQYIEGGELERTWKSTRRQRLKEQEQKIWDEFIKERDVVHTVFEDDPYQFLEQLPEGCLRELMETELVKMKQEQAEEEADIQQTAEAPQHEEHVQHTVTFADEPEKEEVADMFHIFDSEKDDEISGPEEEVLNDSMGSPCTVRENQTGTSSPVVQKTTIVDKEAKKSSENMANLIESSIYCAKVKDIRMKINEEMMAIMSWLERQDILMVEPEEVAKMMKRSGEFCGRFNRIYMYQLQRQMHDVKRNSNTTLPFAKHTQFQSQMVRIVSLHQNLLQAYQAFHRSVEQTWCLRECDAALHALLRATREVSVVCRAAPTPKDFAAAIDLYNDDALQLCEKLDQVVDDYSSRMADFVKNIESGSSTTKSKKFKSKGSFGSWSKSGTKSISDAEARLSMYSLDTIRNNFKPKSTSSKDNQSSGTSKMRGALSTVTDDSKKPPKKVSPRNQKKTSVRAGSARRRAARREPRTLVQAVPQCTSSHISCEASPRDTPRGSAEPSPRAHTNNTPRTTRSKDTPRKSQTTTPRLRQSFQSPRTKPRGSPKPKPLKAVIADITFDPETATDSSINQMTPIWKNDDNIGKLGIGNDVGNEGFDGFGNVDNVGKIKVHVTDTPRHTPRTPRERENEKRKVERDGNGVSNSTAPGYEVTRLLRQLCSGDGVPGRNERVTGPKNAQLLCINGGSPRQPSTPQLLRILEETIQKKVPKQLFQNQSELNKDKYRLTFNIPETTTQNLFQYRTKFVQHMLTSPMYANSAVGKPWEIIGSISERIIDELLLSVAKEMEIGRVTQELYRAETR